jgi:hypothetical protein
MVAHNTTITSKASTKKAQKGHSTDVIGNTSFVEIAINSKKAEVSSNFSSYQTLTTDVNSRPVKPLVYLFCKGNASGGWKSQGTKV